MPIAARREGASFAFLSADRAQASCERKISSGSCSTQPGRGKIWRNSFCAAARGRPRSSNTIARERAGEILGMMLKTHQTGPEGQKVRRLLIEEGADIKKELYVGMVVDRGTQRVALMASSEGGMDIEEVAAKTPEKIQKVFIDPGTGLKDAG